MHIISRPGQSLGLLYKYRHHLVTYWPFSSPRLYGLAKPKRLDMVLPVTNRLRSRPFKNVVTTKESQIHSINTTTTKMKKKKKKSENFDFCLIKIVVTRHHFSWSCGFWFVSNTIKSQLGGVQNSLILKFGNTRPSLLERLYSRKTLYHLPLYLY